MTELSPRVVDHGWGYLEISGLGRLRDAKLWPGGGRAWDWGETGTDRSREGRARAPPSVRHDTARRLVETAGWPAVAAWLGHERLDTVRVYSQPNEAALERAAAALNM